MMTGSETKRLTNILFLVGATLLAAVVLYLGMRVFPPSAPSKATLSVSRTTTDLPSAGGTQSASLPLQGTATATQVITTTAAFPPTQTPISRRIWLSPHLPASFVDNLSIPTNFEVTDRKGTASLQVEISGHDPAAYWVYVLVTPFPSLSESIQGDSFLGFWRGERQGLHGTAPLHLSQESARVLRRWLGSPDTGAIEIHPDADFLGALWPNPHAWAILPFGDLSPKWKVVSLGQQHPLEEDFSRKAYPLAVPITVSGRDEHRSLFLAQNPALSNFQPEHMTQLVMTGVTAMVRDTAAIMEEKGITYPAENIAPLLREADITHISNEVPFATDCPPPDPDQLDLYFCSDDRYLKLLQFVGTDIVELSGDHFGDWGDEAMFHTLALYEEQGWLTYGGGKTLSDGLQPVYFEHNGNRFAFIGCNAKAGKKYATASEEHPGASRCNFSWMKGEIQRLKKHGYLTIATMQHDEVYQFQPNYVQQRDFQALAEAGAVIVSGSQAHQPQGVAFYDHAFIHYGLGNLFFDQHYLAQRVEKYQHADKATLDRHTFYNNRHINTELLTIQFIDNAQSRLMTDGERQGLLKLMFDNSSWGTVK